MKNREEMIIKYLDGQLNSAERADFENSLKNSEELKNLYNEYKAVINTVESAKKITLNETYAESILPEFRRRLEAKKSTRFSFRYTYGLAVVIFIVITALFISRSLSPDKINDSKFAHNDLGEAELETILNQISTEDLLLVYTSEENYKLDSIYEAYFANEIVKDDNADENLFALNDIDFTEIEQILSDEELDFVYNELINKEFF